MADAAWAGIRQDDRFEIRRYEEYRWAPWRRHYGGATVAALRRQDPVGASRHRRHRHGLAANRDQPELGLRLRRAAVGPAGCRILRVTPSRVTPSRVTPSRVMPSRVMPSRVMPSSGPGGRTQARP